MIADRTAPMRSRRLLRTGAGPDQSAKSERGAYRAARADPIRSVSALCMHHLRWTVKGGPHDDEDEDERHDRCPEQGGRLLDHPSDT